MPTIPSPTTTAVCNKLVKDYTGIVQPVIEAKQKIKQMARDFENQLYDTVFTPIGDLLNAINDFQQKTGAIFPEDSVSAIDDILLFTRNCPYLSDALGGAGPSGKDNPASLATGMTAGAVDGINQAIAQATEAVPEFFFGGLAANIDNIVNGIGIPKGIADAANVGELLKQADKLINCIASFCGADYTSTLAFYTTETQELFSELNLDSDPASPRYGQFDYEAIYARVGLNSSAIDNLNMTLSSVSNTYTSMGTAISGTVSAVQNYAKAGGLF